MMSVKKLVEIQKKISSLVELKPLDISKLEYVAAVDISYKKKQAGFAVENIKTKEIVECGKLSIPKPKMDYMPGLFGFRESQSILMSVKKIKHRIDLLLVDGHGYAHPRRAGLASMVGLSLRLPTIGVAKKLLVGKVKGGDIVSEVFDGNELVGYRIKSDRVFYVSPGHKIDFKSVLGFFNAYGYKYPEVLRIADKLSKS